MDRVLARGAASAGDELAGAAHHTGRRVVERVPAPRAPFLLRDLGVAILDRIDDGVGVIGGVRDTHLAGAHEAVAVARDLAAVVQSTAVWRQRVCGSTRSAAVDARLALILELIAARRILADFVPADSGLAVAVDFARLARF